jgi:uncharacterized protein (TIGR02285 family)
MKANLKFYLFLSVFVGFVCFPVQAQQSLNDQELVWYHPNFPPSNFVDGLMEGLGYNDQTEKFIATKLTQYQHKFVVASYQRIIHSLKYAQGCVVGIYKSEQREKDLLFSISYLLTFSNGLIIKEKDFDKFKPYLNEKGFISIKTLLANQQLFVGISGGRQYKGAIDKALLASSTNNNILTRSNTDVFFGLLQMLDKNRIDYLFGFPEELEYHTSLGVLDNKMKFIPIDEMPRFLKSYIACSKNAWGEKAITEINQLLLYARHKGEFPRFYQFWLDFDSKKRHRALTHQVFQVQ